MAKDYTLGKKVPIVYEKFRQQQQQIMTLKIAKKFFQKFYLLFHLVIQVKDRLLELHGSFNKKNSFIIYKLNVMLF